MTAGIDGTDGTECLSGNGHGEKLTIKHDEVITALLTHPTIDSAARASGVAASTLRRWLKDPTFAESYSDVRRQCVDGAIGMLHRGAGEAVDTLLMVMRDINASPSARVSAARNVLDLAFKAAELIDMETRLAAIENVLDAHNRANNSDVKP